MLRKVAWMSLCFGVISACALITSDVEVEKQSVAAPAPDAQPDPAASQPVIATPLTETQSANSENKNISAEHIKRIQAHLKKAAFYSGSVDGIAGPRTQSAIRHFQSACATLRDLITNSEPTAMQQNSGIAAKATINKSKRETADAVRLFQLRLKDAGFNLGQIDGIDGPKTQSARLALQSGCTMLENIPIVPLNDAPAPTADSSANGRMVGALIRATNREPEDFAETTADNSVRGAIKVLQMRLREAGFDVGPVDGILGARTIAAARRYESSLR